MFFASTGPQFSIPSLVWFSVPVSAVPSVPLLHVVTTGAEEAQGVGTVPVPAVAMPASAPVMPRKVIATAASVPVADNTLGVTVAKQRKPGCPYCDSSVFPYCTDKLLHDACCCLNPYGLSYSASLQYHSITVTVLVIGIISLPKGH